MIMVVIMYGKCRLSASLYAFQHLNYPQNLGVCEDKKERKSKRSGWPCVSPESRAHTEARRGRCNGTCDVWV